VEPSLKAWVRVTLLVGVVYLLVGRLFALPATHVQPWRLAAWVLSAAAFGAHVGYELFRLGNSPRTVALHTALAVALGAFALAVAGALHSLVASSSIRLAWLVAFVVWPVATGVPAFLVAFVASTVLGRLPTRRRRDTLQTSNH
jgi:hypothetical protein